MLLRNRCIQRKTLAANDSASIFAATVIQHSRHDPSYMEKLIVHIDNEKIRGAANWRVLRAIRDTIRTYELTDSGRFDSLSDSIVQFGKD